jgi:hypothetical protein
MNFMNSINQLAGVAARALGRVHRDIEFLMSENFGG